MKTLEKILAFFGISNVNGMAIPPFIPPPPPKRPTFPENRIIKEASIGDAFECAASIINNTSTRSEYEVQYLHENEWKFGGREENESAAMMLYKSMMRNFPNDSHRVIRRIITERAISQSKSEK